MPPGQSSLSFQINSDGWPWSTASSPAARRQQGGQQTRMYKCCHSNYLEELFTLYVYEHSFGRGGLCSFRLRPLQVHAVFLQFSVVVLLSKISSPYILTRGDIPSVAARLMRLCTFIFKVV